MPVDFSKLIIKPWNFSKPNRWHSREQRRNAVANSRKASRALEISRIAVAGASAGGVAQFDDEY
jgi:hypothetical protein